MDIFAPICLSELKEKSELIAKLVPPKQNNPTNSASHLFDLSNFQINELFRDNASKLICRIKLVVDYVQLNPIRIIDEKKEDRIEDIFLSFGEEYEELITRAFKMSEDGKNEEMFDLWKHYQYDIEKVIDKILPAISYLQEIKSIHDDLSDNNKAGDFELERNIDLPLKTNMYAIVLFYIYSEKHIDETNCVEIAKCYGWKSGVKLKSYYNEWKNHNHRYAHKRFSIYYNCIFSYLSPKGKEAAKIDLDKFNNEKNKTSSKLVANQ